MGRPSKSLKVRTAKSPSASFSSYATFAVGKEEAPPRSYSTTAMADDVRKKVEALVAREMTQKGYAQGGDGADLVVRVGSGVRKERDVSTAHGGAADVASGNELDVEHDETQGAVRVDVYDTKTNALVFRGVVSTVAAAKEEDPARLTDAIHRMFADFPSR
jgi:hypothetical protein